MKSSADDVDARFVKARARNRAAQLRLRQRQQADLKSAGERLRDVLSGTTAARERHVALQRQRVGLSTRNAAAAVALAAVQRDELPAPAGSGADAAVASLPASQTLSGFHNHAAAADAAVGCGCAPGSGKNPIAGAPQHGRSCIGTMHLSDIHGHSSAMTSVWKRKYPFVQPQHCSQAPRRISDFAAVGAISYGDLCAAADPAARLVDFSKHDLLNLLSDVFQSKAEQLEAAQAHARGDVCWFVQTPYEVAEGLPLSASATLSSPECIASFALHYLTSRLELMLIAAAAPRSRGVTQDVTELHPGEPGEPDSSSCEQSSFTVKMIPAKSPRPPVPRFSAAPAPARMTNSAEGENGGACDLQSTNVSLLGFTQHAQHAQHASGVCATSTAARAEPEMRWSDGPHSAPTAHSVPSTPPPLWSRLVRCGVNGTHDAASAVSNIVHAVVRTCCWDIPPASLCRLLSSYQAALQRMLSSFGQPHGEASALGFGVSQDARDFKAGSAAACWEILSLLTETVGAHANTQALQKWQADESCGAQHAAQPVGQRLEEQAHVLLAAYSVLHHLTLQLAPLTARSLCNHGVFPLMRDGEVDGLHVRLYRELRLTAADRARLVVHWQTWRRVCTALNTPFRSAVRALHSLPAAADIPPALIARVDEVATRGLEECERRDGAGCGNGVHVGHACGDTGKDSARVDVVAAEGAMPLLGCAAEATAAAEESLLGLHAVHEVHGRVRREMMEMQMRPGVMLRPLQLARFWTAHIAARTGPADFMQLAQLAEAQQRWRDLASRPPVLQEPLPKDQWLEGIGVATGAVQRDRQVTGVHYRGRAL